mgnify:CR=1 FL=1
MPLIIGSNKDEATLFSIADPKFAAMTEDDARARFTAMLKGRADKAFAFYREQRPAEQPTWLVTSMMTESGTWINSIRLAERKAAQGQAPVFMYRLDYETPIFGGILRSPHGLDTPMIFAIVLSPPVRLTVTLIARTPGAGEPPVSVLTH